MRSPLVVVGSDSTPEITTFESVWPPPLTGPFHCCAPMLTSPSERRMPNVAPIGLPVSEYG
jgi:hypothetical protein